MPIFKTCWSFFDFPDKMFTMGQLICLLIFLITAIIPWFATSAGLNPAQKSSTSIPTLSYLSTNVFSLLPFLQSFDQENSFPSQQINSPPKATANIGAPRWKLPSVTLSVSFASVFHPQPILYCVPPCSILLPFNVFCIGQVKNILIPCYPAALILSFPEYPGFLRTF